MTILDLIGAIIALILLTIVFHRILNIPTINPLDGKHDDIKYELLGYPTHCKECLKPFVKTTYRNIVTIRCPKYQVGGKHEFFRWTI